jgi:hypothetical protein
VLNPQEEGWTPLREWGARRLAVVAVLLGLPFLIAAVILLHAMEDEVRGLFKAQPLVGGAYLLALIVMVPVHELIHALAYCRAVSRILTVQVAAACFSLKEEHLDELPRCLEISPGPADDSEPYAAYAGQFPAGVLCGHPQHRR